MVCAEHAALHAEASGVHILNALLAPCLFLVFLFGILLFHFVSTIVHMKQQ